MMILFCTMMARILIILFVLLFVYNIHIIRLIIIFVSSASTLNLYPEEDINRYLDDLSPSKSF